jgi:hypothetical protein
MVGLGLRLLRLRRKQSTFISRMRAWWVIRVEQSAGESFRADKQWPFGEGQVACQQQRATLVPLTELDRFVADCAQLQGVFDGKTRLGTGHVGREPFPSPSASPPCGRTRPAFCVARCPRLDNRLTMLNVMVVLARRGISRSTAGCIVARNARERDIHPSPLQRTGPIPCGRDARSGRNLLGPANPTATGEREEVFVYLELRRSRPRLLFPFNTHEGPSILLVPASNQIAIRRNLRGAAADSKQ